MKLINLEKGLLRALGSKKTTMSGTYSVGDFSYDSTLQNAYNVCFSNDRYIDFLKNESPPADKGYIWWNHPILNEISDELDSDGHSGASFACVMRAMQFIATKGWSKYLEKNLPPSDEKDIANPSQIDDPQVKEEIQSDAMKITKTIADREGMDENNKKALDILTTEGSKAAIDFMFKDPKTGRQLSYAEMRSYYG